MTHHPTQSLADSYQSLVAHCTQCPRVQDGHTCPIAVSLNVLYPNEPNHIERQWHSAVSVSHLAFECSGKCPALDALIAVLGTLRPVYSESLSLA